MTRAVRLELAKLAAQTRARAILALCLVAPFLVAVTFSVQDSLPKDTLFGRHLQESGFATPLVVLAFAGTWALPLLTSLVAGDIVSAEDHHATWALLLTRSTSRGRILAAKSAVAAGFAVLLVVVLAAASLVAGVLVVGHQPLISLDGVLLPAGRLTGVVSASWLCVLPPLLGFTAVALAVSTLTRSSVAGIAVPTVAGVVMLLLGFVNGPGWAHDLLLTNAFESWHGLVRGSVYLRPILVGSLVSAGYAVVALLVAWLGFRGRDEARG